MKREPVGERIREARAEKGWVQKELAAKLDVEPITVSRWERGATTPDLDVLGLVAEAMGKPLSYFVADRAEGADLARRVHALEQAVVRIEGKLDALLGD